MDYAQNTMVIKTSGEVLPNMWGVDREYFPDILGILAGDDTVSCGCTQRGGARHSIWVLALASGDSTKDEESIK